MNNLKVSDVFANTNDGFFKIIGGETKLLDLDTRIDKLFGTGEGAATIGDFMDAGIVSDVSAEASNRLTLCIGEGWRNYAIATFIDKIINFIANFGF